MSVVNTLLKIDAGKLDLPQKEFKIKRLSEAAGEPVIFTLKGLPDHKFDEIREMSTTVNGDSIKVDQKEVRLATIVNGVVEPDFKDKSLMEHYGVKTPYDLVKKLLNSGEIESLYEEISNLSGFGDDAVEEVKKQ